MTAIKQIGEFGLIDRLITQLNTQGDLSELGLGDDCAIIPLPDRHLLLSTDSLVTGVHFDLSFFPPESVGYRALAVNISDIAAMGGTPTFALISLQAPADTDVGLIESIYAGLIRCAQKYGVKIVGGNVTSSNELALGITIVGEVRGEPIRRSGAEVGDDIWISGAVGGATAALKSMRNEPGFTNSEYKTIWMERLFHPEPRVSLGQALQQQTLASSMIDVSDGLIQDLSHLTKASGVSAEVELGAIPFEAGADVSAGDDYELLFTAHPNSERKLLELGPRICALTKIGRIVPPGMGNLDSISAKFADGYRHFL